MSAIIVPSPVGTLALQEKEGKIVRIAFVFGRKKNAKEKTPESLIERENAPFETFSRDYWTELVALRYGDVLCETPLLLQAARELREYFKGKLRTFDIPTNPSGTEFKLKVLRELARVPYGETETYGGLAQKIGAPNAARAVGLALRENPIGIVLPCHRVVGASGALTGFNGGIERKSFLLQLEKSVLQKDA